MTIATGFRACGQGVINRFPRADEADKSYSQPQLNRFIAFGAEVRERGTQIDDALTIAEQVDI